MAYLIAIVIVVILTLYTGLKIYLDTHLSMPKLAREIVVAALDAQSVWDVGNNVLYKLCAEHP
jgi:hypothetical protein